MQDLKFVWLKAIAMAWKDPTFKAKLLEEPRAALRSFMGVELPEDVELRVREASAEESASSSWGGALGRLLDIVLPPPPADSNLQVVALASYAAVEVQGRPCGLSAACCFC